MTVTCPWLKPDRDVAGCKGDGGIILGRCGLLGGTAYDKRCETCPNAEAKP